MNKDDNDSEKDDEEDEEDDEDEDFLSPSRRSVVYLSFTVFHMEFLKSLMLCMSVMSVMVLPKEYLCISSRDSLVQR